MEGRKKLGRRTFLKCSVAGVGATLYGCASPLRVTDPAASVAQPPATEATEATEATAATVEIPAVRETLVDPSNLQSETWQEPWTWRPEGWPEARLHLNVTRNQNPGRSPSPGNPTPALFTYNGASPGPTIRVRGDGTLRIKLRNLLGLNEDQTHVGPGPDPFELPDRLRREVCVLVEEQVRGGDPANPRDCNAFFFPEQFAQVVRSERRPGWSIKRHLNGPHATHVTNLHTHGMHVWPGSHADGTHADNVLLRILPQADWAARQAADETDLHALGENECVGEADYRIDLAFEHKGRLMPHPPGTHWYHPHAHGAAHNQVASGMAGFLIVEGDVDEALNLALTGEPRPDLEAKTGPYDYRERLIFLQRVFVQPVDLDAGPKRNNLRFPPLFAVNGVRPPEVMFMRPGAVERWRILNGSVDGSGTKRFMVLRGQYVHQEERLWRVVTESEGDEAERRLEAVTQQELETLKLPLHQLSFDGITLVTEENGEARHTIKDLSTQNAGTQCPFRLPEGEGEEALRAALHAYEACFRDGESLRNSFVRPNELYLANANRADVFFQAPLDADGQTFTIFAQEAHLQTDAFQKFLQQRIARPESQARRPRFDVVVGYVHVRGKPVEGGDFDVQSLVAHLPPVPPLFQPIGPEDLAVPAGEARRAGVPAGSKRTRVVSYSGAGGADFPLVAVPEEFVLDHPEDEDLVWTKQDDVPILLPNRTLTMAVNTDFDLAKHPEPGPPHKFAPHDPKRSQVLVDTAEEWVLYNTTAMLWSHTDRERFPQPGSYGVHFLCYPMSRAEGQRRFHEDPEFRISNMGADHPFHIHVNPMWILRIDVPDENGALHNILPEPRWMDTVPVPRNGGRVVFRTRFDDFVGRWVHHCHILLHEDFGMMQVIECTDEPEKVNYNPRDNVASASMPGAEVDKVYPPPSPELMYRQNLSFIDLNEDSYTNYPGFDLVVPHLSDP